MDIYHCELFILQQKFFPTSRTRLLHFITNSIC
jgi:hypothetical protein